MLMVSVIGLLSIFILDLLFGIKHGFGFRHYWFFETLHFLGGFFLAMFLANFVDSKISIFIGIAIVSFFWEFAEYLIERIPRLSAGFNKVFNLEKNIDTKPNWNDTIFDIILNFAGAAIFVYFVL